MEDFRNDGLIQKYIMFNNFGRTLGMDFSIEREGELTYTLRIEEVHLATPLAAHGGVVAALMDATLGVGALSCVCRNNKVVATVEMQIKFLNPAMLGDVLTASSTCIKKGNRLIFMEAIILNQKGVAIAKASGVFNAYPAEKAGY